MDHFVIKMEMRNPESLEFLGRRVDRRDGKPPKCKYERNFCYNGG